VPLDTVNGAACQDALLFSGDGVFATLNVDTVKHFKFTVNVRVSKLLEHPCTVALPVTDASFTPTYGRELFFFAVYWLQLSSVAKR